MQAADRAGLYLFFVSPGYAAVTCWSARRARIDLGEIARTLPASGLVWRRAWVPYAALGLAFHALVVAATTLTAAASAAVGDVDPYPVVVQFLSIASFCALGALVGYFSQNELAPPGLFLVLVALNTVLVRYGFRRISDVGTGSADFLDLRMNPAYLTPKALLFMTLVLACMPLRPLAFGWRRHIQSFAGASAVVLVLVVLVNPAQPQQYVPGPTQCHRSEGVQICVPAALASRAAELDAPVARTVQLLTIMGLAKPGRVDATSRGATEVRADPVAFSLTAQDLGVSEKVQRQVNLGFAYPLRCEEPEESTPPPPNVLETRAILDGWLAHRTGATMPRAAYPTGAVSRLLAMPESDQLSILAPLFRSVWSCDPNVQPPPG